MYFFVYRKFGDSSKLVITVRPKRSDVIWRERRMLGGFMINGFKVVSDIEIVMHQYGSTPHPEILLLYFVAYLFDSIKDFLFVQNCINRNT